MVLVQEIEVERDVFASEMRRLQTMVKRLKIVNFKMGHENRVVGRLKAKIHHLEVVNQRLSCGLSSNFCPSTPSSAVGDGRYGKVHVSIPQYELCPQSLGMVVVENLLSRVQDKNQLASRFKQLQ